MEKKIPLNKPKAYTRSVLLQHKHLLPVYPLLGMLTVVFGLGAVTAVRQLTLTPTVLLDKQRRTSEILPEMKDAEETHRKGKRYLEGSPLYRLSKDHMP